MPKLIPAISGRLRSASRSRRLFGPPSGCEMNQMAASARVNPARVSQPGKPSESEPTMTGRIAHVSAETGAATDICPLVMSWKKSSSPSTPMDPAMVHNSQVKPTDGRFTGEECYNQQDDQPGSFAEQDSLVGFGFAAGQSAAEISRPPGQSGGESEEDGEQEVPFLNTLALSRCACPLQHTLGGFDQRHVDHFPVQCERTPCPPSGGLQRLPPKAWPSQSHPRPA